MPASPPSLPEDECWVVRPAVQHASCLNGHRQDGTARVRGWDAVRQLATGSCDLCRRLRRPRANWFEIALGFEAPSTTASVALAAQPPAVPGGVEQIMLRLDGRTVADLDVQVCRVDSVAVIEQVRVDRQYLRRGIGTVLVTAAVVRWRDFRWSTTVVDDSVAARAFWAAQDLPPGMSMGEPFRCSHMLTVSEFA